MKMVCQIFTACQGLSETKPLCFFAAMLYNDWQREEKISLFVLKRRTNYRVADVYYRKQNEINESKNIFLFVNVSVGFSSQHCFRF